MNKGNDELKDGHHIREIDEVVIEKDQEITTAIFKDHHSWSKKELEEVLENLRKLLYEARLDKLNSFTDILERRKG
jgi:uncharacterized tellurite resistance protein B-like protein